MQPRKYHWHLCLITSILLVDSSSAELKHLSDSEMADRSSKAFLEFSRVEIPDWRDVTDLIIEERFAEFEERSKLYEKKFQENPLYESPLVKLYQVLGQTTADEGIEVNPAAFIPQLNKWVNTRPSYISYAARGYYMAQLGYSYRGEDKVRDTPEENFIKMRMAHKEAKDGLVRALKDNPKLPITYIGLIYISQASGDAAEATRLVKLADKEIPNNFYVRNQYVEALRPRWGGSYEAMDQYTSTLYGPALANPRIWSLRGTSHAERGYTAILAKNYGEAVEHYSRALSYGERAAHRYWRGFSYMKLGRKKEALADFLKCNETGADSEVQRYIRELSGLTK